MNDELSIFARLATVTSILVLCDFDDALAEQRADVPHARPMVEPIAALEELSRLVRTRAVIVSNRELDEVRAICGFALCNVPHQFEFLASDDLDMSARSTDTLDIRRSRCWLQQAALWVAGEFPGAVVENRTLGARFHASKLDALSAHQAIERLIQLSSSVPVEVHVRRRGWSLTLSALRTDHDVVIDALRATTDACILYVGNDESAHAALHPSDVGCTVGSTRIPGALPLASPAELAIHLRELARLRADGLGRQLDIDMPV